MAKSGANLEIPVAAQSESQQFDIFAVPDVHSVAREEGKPAWDTVVPMGKAASLSPPVPKEDKAVSPENPELPEPHDGPIGWQSMGAGVVKK